MPPSECWKPVAGHSHGCDGPQRDVLHHAELHLAGSHSAFQKSNSINAYSDKNSSEARLDALPGGGHLDVDAVCADAPLLVEADQPLGLLDGGLHRNGKMMLGCRVGSRAL